MPQLLILLIAIFAASSASAQTLTTAQLQQLAVQDAQNAGIDPSTFVAVIQAESGFNPNARNPSGATGIAQILRSTAANPGFGITPIDPTDPVASLQFAAQYLAALQARDGSLTAALTDYSGGLTAANPGNPAYAQAFADAAAADAGNPQGIASATGNGVVGTAPDGTIVTDGASGQTIVTDQPGTGAGAGSGVLDQIVAQFQAATAGWQAALLAFATNLFWILASIELAVCLYAMMIGGESNAWNVVWTVIRWLMPIGLFWWLLQNGTTYAQEIIDSLRLAGTAVGGVAITPSAVFWAGINIATTIWNNAHGFLGTIEEIPVMIAALPIIAAFVLAAVWMLMILIESYIVVGLAALFLAFAGLRWTRQIAISLIMSTLAVGFKLLAISVIVGIGGSFITQWSQNAAGLSFQGIFIMWGAAFALAALAKEVPNRLERIVLNYQVSHAHWGQPIREAAGTAGLLIGGAALAGGSAALAAQAIIHAAEQLSGNSNDPASQSSVARGLQMTSGALGVAAAAAGAEISGRLGGLYRGGPAASVVRMAANVAQRRRVAAAEANFRAQTPPSNSP